MMDFDHLSKEVFEKILRHLSIKGQIRIERVSKRFQEISRLVISKTKSIYTTGKIQNMDAGAISKLLNLCSPYLEEINIFNGKKILWIEILSQFSFPRLTKAFIGGHRAADFFVPIMTKNQNLRTVHWQNSFDGSFTIMPNIVCEKLENLDIQVANNATLRSMTGKFPNLNHFFINTSIHSVSRESFDNFLASCPKMEELRIFHSSFSYDQLVYFWRLKSMRLLYLVCYPELFNDDDLEKISTCFPRMKNLDLDPVQMTNRGFIALASLKNLRFIRLIPRRQKENIDSGVQRLIGGCEHLRKFEMNGQIMSKTLTDLIRHCRELRRLEIHNVIDITTIEEAVAAVRLFGGLVKRNILIYIREKKEIWDSKDVKTALDELRTDRHVIKINDK